MYTDEKVMGWMYSEYRKIKGGHPKDVITGKPAALGGIEGRNSATGYGGFYVLETILNDYIERCKVKIRDRSIALQGYGKVGIWFAEMARQKGYKVVAVSNEYGGTYDPKGLDLNMIRSVQEASAGKEWGCGSKITNEDLLALDVDILVPAAIENVIRKDNVNNIKARMVFELANGPTTNEADAILNDRGCFVVPDILANAGGVVVSYFEWVQNRNGVVKTLEEVNDDLKRVMTYATHKAMEKYFEHKISLRTGTYALALRRIAGANECLGNRVYFRK
jgi:glutamate dehydrogenase/leucine dehydrogenase